MPTLKSDKYQLVIIGAGPAGLAAALYSSREGIKTLVLERGAVGGMAAITYQIDNYAGFHQGITGLELADRLLAHAERFGADVATGVEVKALTEKPGSVTISTSSGDITAESVLITTGSTYRHLGIAGEKDYIGRGVHFCATCDAPLYRGKDILVVGGGNSAIQESLFIAKFASHVTILVRDSELHGTEILEEQLKELKNVSFRYNVRVDEIRGDGQKVTGARVLDKTTNEVHDLRADAVFVFIGLLANTQPFAGTIDLDDDNFIKTRPDYQTNVLGVYAAGDVRSGSTWQIASAVGEGVAAALCIRAYLDKLHHAQKSSKKPVRSKAKTKV